MLIKCPLFHCCYGDKECPPEFAAGIECYKVVKERKKIRGAKRGCTGGPRFNRKKAR